MLPGLSRLWLLELLTTSRVRSMQVLFDLIFSRASRGSAHSWYLKISLARIFLRPSPPTSSVFLQSWRIATRWGVVQSVGHLTVNEDGGGSNPPAPANFLKILGGQRRAKATAAVQDELYAG